MADLILKYTEGEYREKLAEVQGYKNQLESHITNLENYKNDIARFWNDDYAQKTARTLYSTIRQAKAVMNRAQNMIDFYNTSLEDITNQRTAMDSVYESITGKLGTIGVEED